MNPLGMLLLLTAMTINTPGLLVHYTNPTVQ